MKRISLYILIICGLTLASCSQILYKIRGMHEPKMLSEKQLRKYSQRRNIPDNKSFYADTLLLNYIVNQKAEKQQRNDHAQPLQALYFEKDNEYPISWLINCRTNPRTFRLRWNTRGELDSFPPKGNVTPDTLLSQDSLISFLYPVFQNSKIDPELNLYNIYVIYSRMMNRDSRHLIKAIRENVSKSKTKATIYYINTDRLYSGTDFVRDK